MACYHASNDFSWKLNGDSFVVNLFLAETVFLLQLGCVNVHQMLLEIIFAGPSGCGKTTLLKCIVGKHKVDSGSVDVFGEPPGPKAKTGVPGRRVGYMPQELALFDEFSISETLIYFARLYGKHSVEISEC